MTKKKKTTATKTPKETPRHDSDALQVARRNDGDDARAVVTPAVQGAAAGAEVLVSPRPRRRNKKRKRRNNKMRVVESDDASGAGVTTVLPSPDAIGATIAAIDNKDDEEEEEEDADASSVKRLKQEAVVAFADSASCELKHEPTPSTEQSSSDHEAEGSASTAAVPALDQPAASPAKQDTLESLRTGDEATASSSSTRDDHAPVDSTDAATVEPPAAAAASPPPLLAALPLTSDLSIGAAMYDITGPAAEVGMFGYAKAGQLTSGIHMRLRARAFAFHDHVSDSRCVYVVADVGMVSEWVRQAVVTRLAAHAALPRNAYTLENVMISATHTHCSPGGTSHYFIYSMHPPLRGADRQNFECVVTGIVEAIARAHRNLQPAVVRVATGECLGASVNRSEDAYMANPVEERRKYAHDTDKEMTLWRFDGVNGFPIGMLNWFAVHPTSMGNWYTLITGDNKARGYAAHMFEKEHGTNHLMDRPRAFVAAFAQSNEGDVSPNICGPRHCTTQHKDFERMLLVANAQLTTARALYAQAAAAPALTGGIRTAHQYVEYGKIELSPKWHVHRECPPSTSSGCIGVSMMGGTTFDGRGVKAIPEGVTWGDYPKLTTLPQLQGFQKEKPIFFPTARYGLSPAVLPLQLFVIADRLPIAAAPFEITTMAGRRLRAALHDVFRDLGREGVYEPVISGLSNAYCGYLTTREEYAVQRYEGASTHFGPNQLCATCQQFEVLARAVCAAETSSDASACAVETLPPPRVNGVGVWDCNLPVLHDGLLNNTAYGHVVPDTDVLKEYRPGSTATVSFHAAHPKNNLRTQGTFLEVHRWIADARRSDGGIWVMHADDGDANTVFHWRRQGTFASVVTVEWWIPPSTPAGKYRIKVNGDYKQFFSRKIQSYSGVSSTFDVVNDTPLTIVKDEEDAKAALDDSPSSLS